MIDLSIYRQRIGTFNKLGKRTTSTNMKQMTTKYSDNCEKVKMLMSAILCIYVAIFILSNNNFCPSPVNMMMNTPTMPMAAPLMNTPSPPTFCLLCVKLSHFEGYQNHRSSTVFGWTGLSVNKIQKIINGNRRSVGYRLAVWNCARGLVQDGFSHKLHEIKQFITEKKPICF